MGFAAPNFAPACRGLGLHWTLQQRRCRATLEGPEGVQRREASPTRAPMEGGAGLQLSFDATAGGGVLMSTLNVQQVTVEDMATKTKQPMKLTLQPSGLALQPTNGGASLEWPLHMLVRPNPGGGGLRKPYFIELGININGECASTVACADRRAGRAPGGHTT